MEVHVSRFGDLLRKLRKENWLSLGELADQLNISKAYLCGIETSALSPPSLKMILKIARFFGQDARDFVRRAWVDRAPALIREEAEEFLAWSDARRPPKAGTGGRKARLRWAGGRRPAPRRPGRPALWSREAIRARIRSLDQTGRPLGSGAVLHSPGLGGLWTAAIREFGTWKKALAESGIAKGESATLGARK
jgi:transcriptional regulator with XRE-family HTH domain